MTKDKRFMLHSLGQDIAEALDEVQFIGVQSGYGSHPDTCSFNCLITGTTFLTNSYEEAEDKLVLIRQKNYN